MGRNIVLAFVLTAIVLLSAGISWADEGDSCAGAYEGAQKHRRDGRLLLARAELETCNLACPGVLSRHCADWQKELATEIPHVVASVKDTTGEKLLDAEGVESATGMRLATDGSATALDPGEHQLVVSWGDYSVTKTVVLERGQEDLLVEFVLPRASPSSAQTKADDGGGVETASQDPTPEVFPSALEIVGMSLGAVALGLVVGGHLRASHLRKSCAPDCSEGQRAVVSGLWWGAAVGGALGTATFGVGYAFRF